MNLYLDYQKNFFKHLLILKKKNIINFPDDFNNITVEPPPKEYKSDISSNIAMMLTKFNDYQPIDLANILKESFLKNFSEFNTIEVVKPGFLNFSFTTDFWKNYIFEIIKLNESFGSNKVNKKKYNIEFVSANPTGPLHVGHCRGAILGDVMCNMLKFNGHSVTKEYYINDFG